MKANKVPMERLALLAAILLLSACAASTPPAAAPATAVPAPDAKTAIPSALDKLAELKTCRFEWVIKPSIGATYGELQEKYEIDGENYHKYESFPRCCDVKQGIHSSETILADNQVFSRGSDSPGTRSDHWYIEPYQRESAQDALGTPSAIFGTLAPEPTVAVGKPVQLDNLACTSYRADEQDRKKIAWRALRMMSIGNQYGPPPTPTAEEAARIESPEGELVVCEDGYPHLASISFLMRGGSGPPLPVSISIHLYDIGGSVKISAPPDALPMPSAK